MTDADDVTCYFRHLPLLLCRSPSPVLGEVQLQPFPPSFQPLLLSQDIKIISWFTVDCAF